MVLTCVGGLWSAAAPSLCLRIFEKAHITKKSVLDSVKWKSQCPGKVLYVFYSAMWSWVWLQVMSGKKKKLTGIFYFCIRDFITPMIRSICRPSINSTLQRAAFQMARFWNVLSNEMEKRCLYGAVMMHAAVLSLPYRRDVSFNVLQSRGPIRSHVAPGDWSLHGRRRDGGEGGGGGGGERLGVSIIFFPFLSSSRQQAPAKWLWVPPTVKLIELVIRGGRDQHPASRKRVCNHSYISSWERNSRAPRRRPESAVSFLDKMSPDVAELHLTCVTLQQSVWDVLSRCRLSLEALLQRDLSADPSCQLYDGSCR